MCEFSIRTGPAGKPQPKLSVTVGFLFDKRKHAMHLVEQIPIHIPYEWFYSIDVREKLRMLL